MQFYGSSVKVNEYLSNITLTQVSKQKSCIPYPYIKNYVNEDTKQLKNIVMKDGTIIWPYGLLEFKNGFKYYANIVYDDNFKYSFNENYIYVQAYDTTGNIFQRYNFNNVEEKFYLKDDLYVQPNENKRICFYIKTEFYIYELWTTQGISIVNIDNNEKIVTYSYQKDGNYLNFRNSINENTESYNFYGKIVKQK